MQDELNVSNFDPKDTGDITQLSAAIGYSREQLKTFRDKRLLLMREYVGINYSDNGSADKVPVNLIELAMNIYLQRLVAKEPAVSITTDYKQLKEMATRFEMAGDHLINEIDLASTLQMAVTGAMLSMGIVKVGLNRTQVEVGGYLHDAGQPFADYISLEDWVWDMTVDRAENGQYEGNFYTITVDEAQEIIPKKFHKKIITTKEQLPLDRDHDISEGQKSTQREEFRETVRCLDLWLPKQNLVLQCLASDDDTDPIDEVFNVIEWDGPERGPYHKLGFSKIENNTMPIAPAMHWKDLHELANGLFRKLGRQADREKTVHGVRSGGEKDAINLRDANDGDMVAVDDPKNVADIHTGGISQQTLGFWLLTKDLFSFFAGNLDMLGGLGPQSETLGQDQLLSASASMRIQRMQAEVIKFTKGIVRDLCYYLWTDPYINIPLVKRVEGFEDITVPITFSPQDREADFLEYNTDIQPYSMQHQTPESKLMGLRTIFGEFVAPLIPMMQQQGISIDLEALFRKIGKLANLPELDDILTYADPHLSPGEPVGQPPQKATTTNRNYTRRSIPGASDSGKSQIMQNALFGGKPQNSETASLTRPTG